MKEVAGQDVPCSYTPPQKVLLMVLHQSRVCTLISNIFLIKAAVQLSYENWETWFCIRCK